VHAVNPLRYTLSRCLQKNKQNALEHKHGRLGIEKWWTAWQGPLGVWPRSRERRIRRNWCDRRCNLVPAGAAAHWGGAFPARHLRVAGPQPALLLVFRRDWGAEYLAEYKRVIATAPLYTGEYDSEGLEYLELYQTWSKNSATGEISGHHRLDFHGIGYELREDIMQDDWVMHPKGSRISWAVEMTPLVELLNLPLRLNPEVIVSEDDTKSGNYMKRLETLRMSTPTLVQLVHGILWELSFCGGPEDMLEKKEELKQLMAEVDDAIEKGDDSAFVEVKPEDFQ
jgi:hypothetical protein